MSILTYPSGQQVRYTYDTAGRVSAVTTTFNGATTALASGVRYQPFGSLKRLTFGHGLVLTRDHDRAYRLSAQTTGALQDLSYTYDAGDKLTALTRPKQQPAPHLPTMPCSGSGPPTRLRATDA